MFSNSHVEHVIVTYRYEVAVSIHIHQRDWLTLFDDGIRLAGSVERRLFVGPKAHAHGGESGEFILKESGNDVVGVQTSFMNV